MPDGQGDVDNLLTMNDSSEDAQGGGHAHIPRPNDDRPFELRGLLGHLSSAHGSTSDSLTSHGRAGDARLHTARAGKD